MNPILRILTKVFVSEFYRINAGFFLIVIGLCFGFLRDIEHIALAQYFTASPLLLLIPLLVWFLYALKIISFNSIAIKKKENEFVYNLALVKLGKSWGFILVMSVFQFLPAILYGLFLIAMSLKNHRTDIAWMIFGSQAFFWTLISSIFLWEVTHPNPGININFFQRKINSSLIRTYAFIYPEWITRKQPVMTMVTKILSCILIVGISRLYLFDSYDERLFGMGCALTFSFNLVIVFYYHRFENFHFQIIRSLPLSLHRRLGNFISTLVLLEAPEILTIINYCPSNISLWQLTAIVLLGISIGLAAYGLLFTGDILLESFIQKVFAACFIWITLILFKMPIIILAIVNGVIGYIASQKNFYEFEFNSEINSEK
jgi:hypothetical protein